MEWKDRHGEFRIETALLEDISPLGLCLQTEAALPESSVVALNLNGTRTWAIVRHCKWQEIGHFVGVKFAPGSRWSINQFRPQHLTDPLSLPFAKNSFIV